MPIIINDNYTLSSSGVLLSSFNTDWEKDTVSGTWNIRSTSITPRGMRIDGSPTGGNSFYKNPKGAGYKQAHVDFTTLWTGVESGVTVAFAQVVLQAIDYNTGYSLRVSGSSFNAPTLRHVRLTRNNVVVQELAFNPPSGTSYTWGFDVRDGVIEVTRNGSVIITYTDPNPLPAGDFVYLVIGGTVSSGNPIDSNTVRVTSFKMEAFDSPASHQTIDVTPVYSEFRMVQPTLIAQGFLNPAAVYSEFRTVQPVIVPVVYPINVTPVYSQFYAISPGLIGAAAPITAPTVYSEFRTVQPLLATGSVVEPQPVYSEFRTVQPDIIPGPVTIDGVLAYSEFHVVRPILAMALMLNPNAVYSEFYARRPTLKSRFTCNAPASLQDRLDARIVKDGASSCSTGVRGSEGFVKW